MIGKISLTSLFLKYRFHSTVHASMGVNEDTNIETTMSILHTWDQGPNHGGFTT